jgi:hypothetical protein
MIYGYAARTLNEHGLLELREVSFEASPAVLRELAQFLKTSADLLDAGTFRHTHLHIGSVIRDWDRRFPGKDVIVCPPIQDSRGS